VEGGPRWRLSVLRRTNRAQMVLFGVDPTKVLAAQVREEFRSKGTVTGFQVRIFVETRTAYLKKHMTGALRQRRRAVT